MPSRTSIPFAVPLLVIAAIAGLAGCAGPRRPLRIGVNAWPPCELWYVAEKMGYFGRTPVEIVRFSVWSDNMSSLYRGNLDLTHATYYNALYYSDKGEPARIILSTDAVPGGDGLVVRSSLEGVKALRGKRVAVEVNTDEHFLLLKALESFGLTEKDLTIVSTTSEQAARMFIEGQVEACFTYEPFLGEAAAEGGGTVVWTTEKLPGRMIDVLVATEEAITGRRNDLQAVLSAWYKAQEYVRSNPAQAFALMAEQEGMSPRDFAAFYRRFTLFSARDNLEIFRSPAFRAVLSEMADCLLSHGAVQEEVKFDEVFTPEIVERVARSK